MGEVSIPEARLRGAERVEDAAPVGRAVRAVAAPVDDGAVAPDSDPRRLGADVVVADERRGALGEGPAVALSLGVRVQPGSVLVEGDVDELDIVLVVVVEGVQRASLAAAVRSPGGEEVEEDGLASGCGLDGGRGAVREGHGGVGCAFADAGADGDVGAPAARRRRLRGRRVRGGGSGGVGGSGPWRGRVRWARRRGRRVGRLRLWRRSRLCQHTLNRACASQQVRGSGRLRNGRRGVGRHRRRRVGGNRGRGIGRSRNRRVRGHRHRGGRCALAGGERKHEQRNGEQGDAAGAIPPRDVSTSLRSAQHDNRPLTPILTFPRQGLTGVCKEHPRGGMRVASPPTSPTA